MSRSFCAILCLLSLSLLAGCTIAEPAYRPDLGGYAMIDEEKESTVVTNQKLRSVVVTRS